MAPSVKNEALDSNPYAEGDDKAFDASYHSFYKCTVTTFFLLLVWNLNLLCLNFPTGQELLIFPVFVSGFLFADLCSGLNHWFMDTWLPVHTLGFCSLLQHVVRSFRLHHAVPYKFGSSDFYATNGKDVIMVFPPLAAVLLYLRFASSASISATYWWCVFAFVTSFFFGLNSQFHKYAHQKKKAPKFAQLMQKFHIFLPPHHHNVHHTLPYDRHYCVISGLMNYPMDVLRIWRAMEYVISKIFRCQPRSDDAHHRYGTPPKAKKEE